MTNKKYTVAVIEDNPADLSLFRLAFSNTVRQVDLLEYDDGQMAIESLSALPTAPDLIIADGHLPAITTERLVVELKSRPHLSRTPIVVVSGATDPQMEARLSRHGVVQTFVKPLELDAWLKFGDTLLNLVQDPDPA